MGFGLNMDVPAEYRGSAYKRFLPEERHVTRVCAEDVLILMLEGTLYFQENGIPAEVHAGEYYIQRRLLLQEGARPSPGAVYYYIHFLGEYCENHCSLPLRGAMFLREAHARFQRLEMLKNTGGTAVEVYAEFYAILAELKRGSGANEQTRTVHAVISRAAEDLRHNWTLPELAAMSGYSVNHLIQLFRRETGRAPYAYITELRLQAARNLLMNSDLPVTHIAEECGFSSYVNFYKAFVRACSCTPQEWRRQCRGRAENDGRE